MDISLQSMTNVARRFHDLGFNVTVIKAEKHPYHRWTELQTVRQTRADLDNLLNTSYCAIGLINGFNHLITLDIDASIIVDFLPVLTALGLPLNYRWVVRSGSGCGLHVHMCCENMDALKMWRLLKSTMPNIHQIEVRGTGSQTLTYGKHRSGGEYQFLNGLPDAPPIFVNAEQINACLVSLGAAFPTPVVRISTTTRQKNAVLSEKIASDLTSRGGREHINRSTGERWINLKNGCPNQHSHKLSRQKSSTFGFNVDQGFGKCYFCGILIDEQIAAGFGLPSASNRVERPECIFPAIAPTTCKYWTDLHLARALDKKHMANASFLNDVLQSDAREIGNRIYTRSGIQTICARLTIPESTSSHWVDKAVKAHVLSEIKYGSYRLETLENIREQAGVGQLPLSTLTLSESHYGSLRDYKLAIRATCLARSPGIFRAEEAHDTGCSKSTLRRVERELDIIRPQFALIEIAPHQAVNLPYSFLAVIEPKKRIKRFKRTELYEAAQYAASGKNRKVRAYQQSRDIVCKDGTPYKAVAGAGSILDRSLAAPATAFGLPPQSAMLGVAALATSVPNPPTAAGIIESIQFSKPGFMVFTIAKEPNAVTIVVRGDDASELKVGDKVEVFGRWQRNAKYGLQVKTKQVNVTESVAARLTIELLSHGLVTGIGRNTAKKLVAAHPAGIADVLNDPIQLKGVIGAQRAACVRSAVQPIAIAILSAIERYSDPNAVAKSIKVIICKGQLIQFAADPYSMMPAFFKFADMVGRHLGIAANDARRVKAGLLTTLSASVRDGHTCLHEKHLIERTADILNIISAECNSSVCDLIVDNAIDRINGSSYVALSSVSKTEQEIASWVAKLLKQPVNAIPVGLYPGLCAEQEIALRLINGGSRFAILTGGPGTGKTLTIKSLLADAEKAGLKVTLLAPTGKAAHRLAEVTDHPASTVHRVLGWNGLKFNYGELPGNVIVIDETSMLDQEAFAAVLRCLQPNQRLVLVGDPDQLKSVGAGNILSDLLDTGFVPNARLTVNHRAAKLVEKFCAQTSARGILNRIDDEVSIAKNAPPQVISSRWGGQVGVHAMNRWVQDVVNPNGAEVFLGGSRFRVGDPVICRKNKYTLSVYNGQMGTVTAVSKAFVMIDFDGANITFIEKEADQVQLAYALTVHASQGSEYDSVLIPVSFEQGRLLRRDVLYTARTRARSSVELIGSQQALKQGESTQPRRITYLCERLNLKTKAFP